MSYTYTSTLEPTAKVSFTKTYSDTTSTSINIVITKVEYLSKMVPLSNIYNIQIPGSIKFSSNTEQILGVKFNLNSTNVNDFFLLTIGAGIQSATLPSNILSAALPLSMKILEFSIGTLISASTLAPAPGVAYYLESVTINKNLLIENGDILEEKHMKNIRFATKSATISPNLIIGEGISKATISLSNINNVITFIPINVKIPNTMKDLTYINGLIIECSDKVALESLTINTALNTIGTVSKQRLFDSLKYNSNGCLVNFGEGITGISDINTTNNNTSLKLTLNTVPKSFLTEKNLQGWNVNKDVYLKYLQSTTPFSKSILV